MKTGNGYYSSNFTETTIASVSCFFCLIIQGTIAFLLNNCYNYNKKTGVTKRFL